MKKLPLGISTFGEIIKDQYTYVDKTPMIKQLADYGKYIFLSRPRRFGKSLFLDTLKEAFEGNQELFKGLYLEKNWDWSVNHPVIRIDFGRGITKSRSELDNRIKDLLSQAQEVLNIQCQSANDVAGCFAELIRKASEKYQQKAVILIDEYDKPILDNITDSTKIEEIREGLKNIYSVVKSEDAHIHFAFMTGVSKFAKVSMFSGPNNFKDITLDRRYATICGYTEKEMLETFSEYPFDHLDDVRSWYNGYNFLGEKVYNPFSILNYLDSGEFKNFWFESGTTSFLIKLIQEKRYTPFDIENAVASESLISKFDVDAIPVEALMFQTGYLTIRKEKKIGLRTFYELNYPNFEVRESMNEVLLEFFGSYEIKNGIAAEKIYANLLAQEIELLIENMQSLYASIPHDWYRKNDIAHYEGYYASIFYSFFSGLGLDTFPEDVTNKGQIDMSLKMPEAVYLFEFKTIKNDQDSFSADQALQQIIDKKYHEKYLTLGKPIFRVGIVFDQTAKNIHDFAWDVVGKDER